jgi:hypothetical protein
MLPRARGNRANPSASLAAGVHERWQLCTLFPVSMHNRSAVCPQWLWRSHA